MFPTIKNCGQNPLNTLKLPVCRRKTLTVTRQSLIRFDSGEIKPRKDELTTYSQLTFTSAIICLITLLGEHHVKVLTFGLRREMLSVHLR